MKLAFVDLETTGLGPKTHRIIEIGVITGDHEIHSVMENRPGDFDEDVFALLARKIPRLSRTRIVRLPRRVDRNDQYNE